MYRNWAHWLLFRGTNYWSRLWSKTVIKEHQVNVPISTSLHPFPAVPTQGKPWFPLAMRADGATHHCLHFHARWKLGMCWKCWSFSTCPWGHGVQHVDKTGLDHLYLTYLHQVAISKSPVLTTPEQLCSLQMKQPPAQQRRPHLWGNCKFICLPWG